MRTCIGLVEPQRSSHTASPCRSTGSRAERGQLSHWEVKTMLRDPPSHRKGTPRSPVRVPPAAVLAAVWSNRTSGGGGGFGPRTICQVEYPWVASRSEQVFGRGDR